MRCKDKDGRYTTILVDPADKGNKLYYYDTQDWGARRVEQGRGVGTMGGLGTGDGLAQHLGRPARCARLPRTRRDAAADR